MKKEDLEGLTEKRIQLTCIFGNSEPIFYTGFIKFLREDTLEFEDKFFKRIIISLENIRKVEIIEGD